MVRLWSSCFAPMSTQGTLSFNILYILRTLKELVKLHNIFFQFQNATIGVTVCTSFLRGLHNHSSGRSRRNFPPRSRPTTFRHDDRYNDCINDHHIHDPVYLW
jgi:hypothetical protein